MGQSPFETVEPAGGLKRGADRAGGVNSSHSHYSLVKVTNPNTKLHSKRGEYIRSSPGGLDIPVQTAPKFPGAEAILARECLGNQPPLFPSFSGKKQHTMFFDEHSADRM